MDKKRILAIVAAVMILVCTISIFITAKSAQGVPVEAPIITEQPVEQPVEETDDELEEEPKPWSEYGESDCQAMGTKAWWDNTTSSCNETCYNSSTQCGNEISRNEDGTCAYTGDVCNRSDCQNRGINAEDAPAC